MLTTDELVLLEVRIEAALPPGYRINIFRRGPGSLAIYQIHELLLNPLTVVKSPELETEIEAIIEEVRLLVLFE